MSKDVDLKFKIVIIDDDFVVRQVLGLLLKRFAHKDVRIFTSDNGLEGLGYLMIVLPDVIVLDTTLPKYSGTELAEFIVSNPRYHGHKLKVLLIEGKDQLSEGFLNLNKSDKDFVEKTIVSALGTQPSKIKAGLIDRILLAAGQKTLNYTDRADQLIKKKDVSKGIHLKFWYSLKWLAAQVKLSVFLLVINLFLGRWKDENEVQNREDLRKYRVRYYPTFATFFISSLLILLQALIYVAGGITILNSRLDSVFADRERQVILTHKDAYYSTDNLEVVDSVIYLKELPSATQEALLPSRFDGVHPNMYQYVLGATSEDSANQIDQPDALVEQDEGLDVGTEGDLPELSPEDSPSDENVEEVVQIALPPTPQYSSEPQELNFFTNVEYSKILGVEENSSHNNSATSVGEVTQFDEARSWGIYYQISPNSTDWYYHNGTEWVITPAGVQTSNTVQELNKNLDEFTDQFKTIYFKAFMKSDGSKQIFFESLIVHYEVGIITLNVGDSITAEEPPVEVQLPIDTILDGMEVKILSAAWVNGNKVVTGNVVMPEGIAITEDDLDDAVVEIYYTKDQDITKPATSIIKEIGQSPLSSYTNPQTSITQYSFELIAVEEPGGYVTARLIVNKAEEQIRYITNYSHPVENSTFTVNMSNDAQDMTPGDGICDAFLALGTQCTLRAAIEETNALAGSDNIYFDIISPSPIVLFASLPVISDAVVLDAATQTGASCGSLYDQATRNIIVEVDGGGRYESIQLTASDSTVRGLAIYGNGVNGISVSNAANVLIECNNIGTNLVGTAAVPNFGDGVFVENTTSVNITNNIISGNGDNGVKLSGGNQGAQLSGNFIGVGANGLSSIPNGADGVNFVKSSAAYSTGVSIGSDGLDPNIIANNAQNGVYIEGAFYGEVYGNNIGVNLQGNAAPNQTNGLHATYSGSLDEYPPFLLVTSNNISHNSDDGVLLETQGSVFTSNTISYNGADGVSIGHDTYSTSQNIIRDGIISNNLGNGVSIIQYIAPLDQEYSQLNGITNNVIENNQGIGIDLYGIENSLPLNQGATSNDTLDADLDGGNKLLNYPEILSYDYSSVSGEWDVAVDLDVPNDGYYDGNFRIDIWGNSSLDIGGGAEGSELLCSTTVTSQGIGSEIHTFQCPEHANYLTATTTFIPDAFGGQYMETSEFSPFFIPAFLVNSAADIGDNNPGNGSCYTGGTNSEGEPECTLRAALEEANADLSEDYILFNIPVSDPSFDNNGTVGNTSDDSWTITPFTLLPPISAGLVIDGIGLGVNDTSCNAYVLPIVLDGSLIGEGSGFDISGVAVSVIGVSIVNWPGSGIHLLNSTGSTVKCNLMEGNSGEDGLGSITSISGSGNMYYKNRISNSLGYGIYLTGGVSEVIGTHPSSLEADMGNEMDANVGGVYIGDSTVSHDNTVIDNVVSNHSLAAAIEINGSYDNYIFRNTVTDNDIGIVAFSNPPGSDTENVFSQNSVFATSSASLPIDLDNDDVINNDLDDIDSGPNRLQNSPLLKRYEFDSGISQLNAYGSLETTANSSFLLEFFIGSDGLSGHVSERYVGSYVVTTGGDGLFDFTAVPVSINGVVLETDEIYLTATATSCTTSDCTTPVSTSEISPLVTEDGNLIVNSTGLSGDITPGDGICSINSTGEPVCTLQAAIQEANLLPGRDYIAFDISDSDSGKSDNGTPGDPGDDYWSIVPVDNFDPIAESVIIDGSTQSNGSCSPMNLAIEINGINLTDATNEMGLEIAADDTEVRGLVINRNTGAKIKITGGADNVVIQCNILGLNKNGDTRLGGTLGISTNDPDTEEQSNGIIIGGATPQERNVISGNITGISLNASSFSFIQGNFIGTDITGTQIKENSAVDISMYGNGIGQESDSNVIGGDNVGGPSGSCTGECNVIAGAGNYSIDINEYADFTQIKGNFIEFDVNGVRLISGEFPKIASIGADDLYVANNLIGAELLLSGTINNIEVFSNEFDMPGVNAISAPWAGVENVEIRSNTMYSSGSTAAGITINSGSSEFTISQNLIYNFGNPGGIVWDAVSPVPSPSLLFHHQNGEELIVTGSLENANADTDYRLEFFGSELGESEESWQYLGTAIVTTDALGDSFFTGVNPVVLSATLSPQYEIVTATATECRLPDCEPDINEICPEDCDEPYLSTSEFGTPTEAATSISGQIYQDMNSDGDLADGVALPGVDVHLYLDDGNGQPDAIDVLAASVVTDGSGHYEFVGTYYDEGQPGAVGWIAVDPNTVVPSQGSPGGSSLSDQTYGFVGAICQDDLGAENILSTAGNCFGGRFAQRADDIASGIEDAEHLTRVAFSQTDIANVNFGFGFEVITNTNLVGQGSLEQFILNSNHINGIQSSQFQIPHSDSGCLSYSDDGLSSNVTPGTRINCLDSGADPDIEWWSIEHLSGGALLDDAMNLDGTTQEGSSCNPLKPSIEIQGESGPTPYGFTLANDDIAVRGFAFNAISGKIFESGDFTEGDGIFQDLEFKCNIFDADPSGKVSPSPNSTGMHIYGIENMSFGGQTIEDRNVIFPLADPNQYHFDEMVNVVFQNNYIGTDVEGLNSTSIVNPSLFRLRNASNIQIIGNVFGNPLTLYIADGAIVQGNNFGIDPEEEVVIGNQASVINAYQLEMVFSNVTIGGDQVGEGNIFGGKQNCIQSTGSTFTTEGNFFGTNRLQNADLGATNGIYVIQSSAQPSNITNNVFKYNDSAIIFEPSGGYLNITGNQISDAIRGIDFQSDYLVTPGLSVTGNSFTDITEDAIHIYDTSGDLVEVLDGVDISNNEINNVGGDGIALSGLLLSAATLAANTVSDVDGSGVRLINVNSVNIYGGSITSTGEDGIVATGNTVFSSTAQEIYNSAQLAIDLEGDSVTANDTNDLDTGSNNLQNFPVITQAARFGSTLIVQGYLNSEPNTDYRIDFYANDVADPSGFGEGQIYVGYSYVNTDEEGNINFTESIISGSIPQGQYRLTSTATQCASVPCGDGVDTIATSEFSGEMLISDSDDAGIIEVNSSGGLDDIEPGDGICYTGQNNGSGKPECTLEAAIAETNALDGEDVVTFNLPTNDPGCLSFVNNGVNGSYNNSLAEVNCLAGNADPDLKWWRINPTITHYYGPQANNVQIDLLQVTDSLILNATTQQGYRVNSAIYPSVLNGQPVVEILCEKDLCVNSADQAELSIQGLVLSYDSIVPVSTVMSGYISAVESSYIGTDISGHEVTSYSYGIVTDASSGCPTSFMIGGAAPQARNIIAGYTDSGIVANGCGSTARIQGNLIGARANATPQSTKANSGIVIEGVSGLQIGGSEATANLITGNIHGVEVRCPSEQTRIISNEIYANDYGVYAVCSSSLTISQNQIFSNIQKGIALESLALNEAIIENSIYLNGDIGIDLENDGVTTNDYQDPDSGANSLQNYPVILAARRNLVQGNYQVLGGFNSVPNQSYRLDFYASDQVDLGGTVEGDVHLGYEIVTTNNQGSYGFNKIVDDHSLPVGYTYMTALATGCTNSNCGSMLATSEFSAHYEVDFSGSLASIDISEARIRPTESLRITLHEADLNLNPNQIETATVALVNNGTNEVETIMLLENSVNTGIFSATFDTIEYSPSSSGSNNGVIAVRNGDILEVVFMDTTTNEVENLPVTYTATVYIDNQPFAEDDQLSVPIGGTNSVNVLANDIDPDNNIDPTTLTISLNPINTESVVIVIGVGVVQFSAVEGYIGYDRFEYTVCDTTRLCDSGVVHVSIGMDLPQLNDDTAQTDEDNEVLIDVLSNDFDASGVSNEALNIESMQITTAPTHGEVFIDSVTGQVEYSPNDNYNGNDQFQYSICGDLSGGCSSASVFVTILPIPDPPSANDDYYITALGRITLNVLDNDWDPDGDLNRSSLIVVSAPDKGTVDIDPDQNVLIYSSAPDELVYTTELRYEVCDMEGRCDQANVRINFDVTGGRTTLSHILTNINTWLSNRNLASTQSAASIGAIVIPTVLVASLASVIGFNPVTIYYLALTTLSNLFSLFSVKKRRVPFGIVYNSVTKEPVSRALVRAYDADNKLVSTSVTDLFGVFEADLRDGVYRFVVQKQSCTFPSKVVIGKVDDPLVNVYHGEVIEVKAGRALDLSVPIDSGKTALISKFETKINAQLKNGFEIMIWGVFGVGLILSVVVLINSFSYYNLFVTALYVPTLLMVVISRAAVPSALYSKVVDTNGNPVSKLDIGLKEEGKESLISRRVTDDGGRYRFITSKDDEYVLDVITRNYRVTGGESSLSKGIYRKRGEHYNVIGKDLVVEKIQL